VLPLVLPAEQVREIMDKAESDPGIELNVDLVSQRVWDESEEISITFEIDAARKDALVNGLDDIGLTLRMEQDITDFESKHGL
jgi:3-isopropylmalate/(R)-2-methylmalate dehydratase small subunit